MSGMKRLAIVLAALVVIPCLAVLRFVWSASSSGPGGGGVAAVSVGFSEAIVEVFLAVLVMVLAWWGWTRGRQHWRRPKTVR